MHDELLGGIASFAPGVELPERGGTALCVGVKVRAKARLEKEAP
jgi:hypothetical protein